MRRPDAGRTGRLVDRIGGRVALQPGNAIPYATLAGVGGGKALMDHLRALTYDLAYDPATPS